MDIDEPYIPRLKIDFRKRQQTKEKGPDFKSTFRQSLKASNSLGCFSQINSNRQTISATTLKLLDRQGERGDSNKNQFKYGTLLDSYMANIRDNGNN